MREPISAEDAINALYLGILGRQADRDGLNAFLDMKARGTPLVQIAAAISQSAERRQQEGIRDQSQYGEFKLLLGRMVAMAAPSAVIVDVGARGRDRSNSYDLMKTFGWKGLLIEANPRLWDSIERDFAGLDFQLVRCGISTTTGTAILYLGVNEDVASVLPDATSSWGPIEGKIKIETRRLGDVLHEHQIPHDFGILSIDIEGLDVPVLLDLLNSTRYAPRWIVIETIHEGVPSMADIGLASIADRYRVVAETLPNVILEAIAD